jgi:predicted sulfurtransferase
MVKVSGDASETGTQLENSSDTFVAHLSEENPFVIALYYCYVPLPDVTKHITFHHNICMALNLKGRIRVAPEGINGVLSGLRSNLVRYEILLRENLEETSASTEAATVVSDFSPERSLFDLDVKYCSLRQDLPGSSQLFPSLSVKATDQVVSLVELENQKRGTLDNAAESGECTSRNRRCPQSERKELRSGDQHQRRTLEIVQSSMQEALSPFSDDRAPHLSPMEWNDMIAELTKDPANDVILLDCRNVYESNIGHFCVPKTSTILTNTRKFQDLPGVLASAADRLSKSSHIFSYCTGGVRCERATVFLDKLLGEKHIKLDDTYAPVASHKPKIYQLRGGIQRYLESDNTKYYIGKNFVFDPRRTDPNHTNVVVGQCCVCGLQHDDYDNGAAPVESNVARCYKCRILLLVCHECRPTVLCSGETTETAVDHRRRLYCGGVEQECLQIPPVREVQN